MDHCHHCIIIIIITIIILSKCTVFVKLLIISDHCYHQQQQYHHHHHQYYNHQNHLFIITKFIGISRITEVIETSIRNGYVRNLVYHITRHLLAVIITHMTQLDEITAVVDPTKLLLELISHFTSRLTFIDR